MFEGKSDMLDLCRNRRMKVVERPINLLETHINAVGVLDGMEVTVDAHCIAGMPGDSQGAITLKGNLAHLLAVLARVWPGAPEMREVASPGRQSWPDERPPERKEEP